MWPVEVANAGASDEIDAARVVAGELRTHAAVAESQSHERIDLWIAFHLKVIVAGDADIEVTEMLDYVCHFE